MLSLADVIPLHLADVTFPDFHPLSGQGGPIFGFAIRHPDGVFLFDTGAGSDSEGINAAYQLKHYGLADRLQANGIEREAVQVVANSHLHFDHCGENRLFPGISIYVQAREHRAAQTQGYTVARWVDFPGAAYHLIEDEHEFTPGLALVPTYGHTPGHQSLTLETDEGLVVLAGQAIYSRREYEHLSANRELLQDDPPPDPEAYLASALQLIDLRPRRVYFSHDNLVWEPRSSV